MPGQTQNIIGRRFNRLVVLDVLSGGAAGRINGGRFFRCQCDCGEIADKRARHVLSGVIVSCGCYRRTYPTRLRHGEAKYNITPEYRTWKAMINRCTNPKASNFHKYGGRGITVCAEWRNDYLAFLSHMGRKPTPDHSLDRYPDNEAGYKPGNVRWATASEQRKNQRPKKKRVDLNEIQR